RMYGLSQVNPRNIDYFSLVLGSLDDTASGSDNHLPTPGTQVNHFVVDSFTFRGPLGLVPSVAMVTRTTEDHSHDHDAVNNVTKMGDMVVVSPNPASD